LTKSVAVLALAFGVLGGLSASAVLAQPGHIVGTVYDADGDPIEGATIVLGGTPHSVTTSFDGTYRIQAEPGEYLVLAAASGYAAVEKPIRVETAQVADLDFELGTSLTQFGDEVVVLGSRATRTAIETPVPVDVLGDEEIESTGMTEVSRIIQFLAPSFNFSTSTISDGTDIVRPSTLRGLGPDQTLVLVNGKRRHNSALVHVNGSIGRGTAGVDLNSIPVAAIERIEILRDGAAAQYGSDAISGVVNIILKSTTATTRVDVNGGQHYESDGEVFMASANGGWRIGDGGFINLTGEYRDRGWTNRAGEDPRRIFNFLEQELFEPALTEGTLDPREDTYDRLNHRYGDASSKNGYLWLNSEIPVSDSATFYFFGGISDREGESAGFNRLPSQGRTNIFVQPEGHLPMINTQVDDRSFSAGFRMNFSNYWAMDVSAVYGMNDFNFFISNSANTSIGPPSETSADAGTLSFDQTSFNLDFYGTSDWGLTNPVNIAAGIEWRQEGYKIEEGEFLSWGDGGFPDQFGGVAPFGIQVFPGFRPTNAVDETRNNFAVYGDLELDLSDRFLLGVAARFEDYSDFGNTVIGKLAGRYQITDRFAIRGSAQTGFRAPSLHQAWFNNVSTQFVDVDGELLPLEVGTFSVDSDVAQALGAEPLTEEQSTSFSVGFTSRPRQNISITADAYSIDIDDRVVISGRFQASQDPLIEDLLEPFGVNGAQFFTNAIDTETQGLDLVAAWSTRVGSQGTVGVTGAFSWSATDVTRISAPPVLEGFEATLFPEIEIVYIEEAQPHQAYNIGTNYTRGPLAATLRFNYFGKVASTESNTDPARKQVFGGKWLTDLNVAWRFDNGLTISGGANNIFDQFPDENIPSNSFNGIFVYPRRTAPFGFNGGYYYLAATFEF
jgi:iron complex outermembrane receptor protein